MAKSNSPRPEVSDLVRTGRVNTEKMTNTVVEDRTDAPADGPRVEYVAEHREVGGRGTTLTTYGEPVGGFPEAEAEVSA